MLAVRSLNLAFKHTVLHDLTFEVAAGSIVGIVGPSGGGKSSLLKIIAGLLDANSGEVTWRNQRVKGPADQLVPGHPEIQLVNQDFGLDIYHTVEENVVQKMLYLPNDVRKQFSEELLDLVELTHLRSQQAIHLSGGEQQRLAIARSLAVEPEVILLDEPFAHLDAHLKVRIGNYLKCFPTYAAQPAFLYHMKARMYCSGALPFILCNTASFSAPIVRRHSTSNPYLPMKRSFSERSTC